MLLKTGQQLFLLHEEHGVTSSSLVLRIAHVAQLAEHVKESVLFLWLYSIEVITSGCLPENQGSIPCIVASRRHVSNFSLRRICRKKRVGSVDISVSSMPKDSLVGKRRDGRCSANLLRARTCMKSELRDELITSSTNSAMVIRVEGQ